MRLTPGAGNDSLFSKERHLRENTEIEIARGLLRRALFFFPALQVKRRAYFFCESRALRTTTRHSEAYVTGLLKAQCQRSGLFNIIRLLTTMPQTQVLKCP